MKDREFDLILFGATGFVGELTAHYLAEHAPPGLRWAIAGRSEDKLAAVRSKLTAHDAKLVDLPLIVADSADQQAIDDLAARTRLVLTTVGPFSEHGEPLVKACAAAGTDYVDSTGEPGFVDEMYLKYDTLAKETRARLIHCAGFDSVPHDLGAYFTVLQLPEHAPITVESRVRASMKISGGTLNSALVNLASPLQTVNAARKRRSKEPRPVGRKVGMHLRPLVRDRKMGMWVAPLPTVDQFIVMRSAAALERYGPDFRYGHNYAAKSLTTVVVGTSAVASIAALAQIPPLRRKLSAKIPPGTGPDAEQRKKNWFRVEFVGRSGEIEVRTAISGGDPGYGETAKMLSELAFALLYDDVPARSGQLTPVAAAGDALLMRLPKVGIKLEVL
jgi:saccharopine dehydrogenase (NAD+, L-glutamate forming)